MCKKERRGLRTGFGSSCCENAPAPQPPSVAGAMLPPKASSSSFGCCIAACIEPLDAPQSLEPEGSDAPSSSPQPPLSVVCESRYGVSGFQTCGPHARAQRRQGEVSRAGAMAHAPTHAAVSYCSRGAASPRPPRNASGSHARGWHRRGSASPRQRRRASVSHRARAWRLRAGGQAFGWGNRCWSKA